MLADDLPPALASRRTLARALAFVDPAYSFWKASAFSLFGPSSRFAPLAISFCADVTRLRICAASRCLVKRSLRTCLMRSTICMALMVFTMRFRLYLTGVMRFFSKLKVLSMTISLPRARRYAFVHFILRGLCFILKCLWHLERQKRNVLQSLRT